MIAVDYSRKRIKTNEREALFFMEFDSFEAAEKILLENLSLKADSVLTYDLLIRIYHQRNDMVSLTKLLNSAMQNTDRKEFYRKLKKQVVVSRLFDDLRSIDS